MLFGFSKTPSLRPLPDCAPLWTHACRRRRRQAVLRTAPIALLLYSLIVLWFAHVGHLLYRPLVRPWYRTKVQPSFADMLRTLRRESLLATIPAEVGSVNVPPNLIDRLLLAANAAP